MPISQIEQLLDSTFQQGFWQDAQRHELRQALSELDEEHFSQLRNRAFELLKTSLPIPDTQQRARLKWLEQLLKTLDGISPFTRTSAAYFSPGHTCREAICQRLQQARHCVDICVFTLADDRIIAEIVQAHQRQVRIRIITDDDKALDSGSDVGYLQQQGIELYMDNSPYLMHHKFALFDEQELLNGSYNWTRSASEHNNENVLITRDIKLVKAFQKEFEQLWQKLRNLPH